MSSPRRKVSNGLYIIKRKAVASVRDIKDEASVAIATWRILRRHQALQDCGSQIVVSDDSY
jgi:hypothetical protein